MPLNDPFLNIFDDPAYLKLQAEYSAKLDELIIPDSGRAIEPKSFTTKDSGKRRTFDTGFVRDVQDGKPRFDLLRPKGVPYRQQILTRLAELLARGAAKYGDRNWEQARTEEELESFLASAERHMAQWLSGETDEDHAAAVLFNVMAAETVKYHIDMQRAVREDPMARDDRHGG